MQTLILAGGFGTRLRNIVKDYPKSMAVVNNKPFLEYLVLQLKKHSIIDIILSIGYLGKKIKEYFKDGTKWGVNIKYSEEDRSLGTGGALRLAQRIIKEDNFLVLNGHSYLDIDFGKLIKFHENKRAIATIALVAVDNPKRYGLVEIADDGQIIEFVEKEKNSGLNLINGGVYVFSREIFDFVPEGKVSLEKDIFPKMINHRFYGVKSKAYFIDMGTPEDYRRVQKDFKRRFPNDYKI